MQLRQSSKCLFIVAALTASTLSWPGLADAQYEVVGDDRPRDLTVQNQVYAYHWGEALTFDVFMPERPTGAGVISIVSGGYGSSWIDPDEERVRYAPMLNAGFVVFSVRHGSTPHYVAPDQVAQLTHAVRYIRYHAPEWGVDPERLGITGGSSGAHLALVVAFGGDDGDPGAEDPVLRTANRIAAVVALAAPTDLRPRWGQPGAHAAFAFPEEELERMSPVMNVSSDDPPTLLVYGTEDVRRFALGQRLAEVLTAFGVSNDLLPLENTGHDVRGPGLINLERVEEARVRWFSEHLIRR